MKIRIIPVVLVLSALLLSACGISEENLALINENLTELDAAKREAEALNGTLTVDTFGEDLQKLSEDYDKQNSINTDELKDEDVEAVVSGIDELVEAYEKLSEELEKEQKTEQLAMTEEEKYKEIPCYIENRSGVEFTGLVIRDVSRNSDSENILTDPVTLPSGRIIAGVVITVYEDSSERTLIATDNEGNEYSYSLELTDIPSFVENGISIIIGDPESGLTISGFTQ